MLVTPQREFPELARRFRDGGADLNLATDGSVLRVITTYSRCDFRIPAQVEANNGRMPGWFLSAIWDYMGLLNMNEKPDSQQLDGWGFKWNGTVWEKSIDRIGKWLLYNKYNNYLYFKDPLTGQKDLIGEFPTKSIYHAQKLFEENDWFERGESKVETLSLDDYIL